MGNVTTDVVVVGSGAGGATVAGELARRGLNVTMVEAGPHGSGEHGRNADSSIAGTPRFVEYLGEHLGPLNGQPQSPERLPGLVGIHGVGGMLQGWTHNCPTPDWWELPTWLDRDVFSHYLDRAREVLHIGTSLSSQDPRYPQLEQIVSRRIGLQERGREVGPMPVAARALPSGWRFSAADDLLADSQGKITIVADHVVRSVLHRNGHAHGVLVHPSGGGAAVEISAGAVVIAAGTLGSAQLIKASKLSTSAALGAYLTEHSIVATRVHFRPELRAGEELSHFPPSVWVPSSITHPRSTQVQSFPLNFNSAVPNDLPLHDTIDIFSFCPVQPVASNRLEFDEEHLDGFGLPAATGAIELSEQDFGSIASALQEVFMLSSDIGDLVSGWSMAVPPRGGSMHLMGSCRMGIEPSDDSVVAQDGRIWEYDNCYIAGNAVLGQANASNPTLTTIAFALQAADSIIDSSQVSSTALSAASR